MLASKRPTDTSQTRPRILRFPAQEADGTSAVFVASNLWRIVSVGLTCLACVVVVVASTVTLPETVTANGVLLPHSTMKLYARSNGTIETIQFRNGQRIDTGDTLATIVDPEIDGHIQRTLDDISILRDAGVRAALVRRNDIMQRQVQRQEAAAKYQQAMAALRERMSAFGVAVSADTFQAHHQFGSHAELDRSVAEVRAAEGGIMRVPDEAHFAELAARDAAQHARSVRLAELSLRELQERKQAGVITATIGGLVIAKYEHDLRGRTVRQGELIAEIADTSSWMALMTVSAVEVMRINDGDSADLSLMSSSGKEVRVRGTVEEITVAPEAVESWSSGQSLSYRVRIVFDRQRLAADIPIARAGIPIHAVIVGRRVSTFSYFIDLLKPGGAGRR